MCACTRAWACVKFFHKSNCWCRFGVFSLSSERWTGGCQSCVHSGSLCQGLRWLCFSDVGHTNPNLPGRQTNTHKTQTLSHSALRIIPSASLPMLWNGFPPTTAMFVIQSTQTHTRSALSRRWARLPACNVTLLDPASKHTQTHTHPLHPAEWPAASYPPLATLPG